MPAKRPAPLSVRFSADQLARLERQANGIPLGTYIKAIVLDPDIAAHVDANPTRTSRSLLAQILALLGPVASALNIILATLARGALDLEPNTEAAIRTACADIGRMKVLLMQALKTKER